VAGIETIYPAGSGSPPAAPYDLGVAQNAAQPSSSLVLAWTDAASTESGFRVERSTNGSAFTQIASTGANVATFTDTNLTAGTLYYYRVRAYNGAGNSVYSNVASATTAAPTSPPAAPTSPAPGNNATNVTATTVSWSAPAGATSYDLYFGTASTPSFTSSTSATSVSVGKLAAGVKYYWRVVAKNSVGNTSGPTWSFTTKAKGRPR
jgi:Fibronectin type III domain